MRSPVAGGYILLRGVNVKVTDHDVGRRNTALAEEPTALLVNRTGALLRDQARAPVKTRREKSAELLTSVFLHGFCR